MDIPCIFLGYDHCAGLFLFYEGVLKKGVEMKKTALLFCVSVVLLCIAAGCAPLIIGGIAGAVGGYAASKDTIQGDTDKFYESIWDAALSVSKSRGVIIREDMNTGSIEFSSGNSRVWIKLVRMTQATTRLKVSSRKLHFPDLAVAQEIFLKIMEGAR